MSMNANLLRVTNTELDAYLANSSLLADRIYFKKPANEEALSSIDKSWQGILFLLTGQSIMELTHPMASVLVSGQMVDEDQDMGYGPAFYLTATQVKELEAELSKITVEELAKNFNATQMTELEIYPLIWEDDDALDYLLAFFKELQAVYATAAKNDEAIITFIN